jgi:hypothetical protein
MNRIVTVADINSAARGCGMWQKTPDELYALAVDHDRLPGFASQVIARAAREVADTKRIIQAAYL